MEWIVPVLVAAVIIGGLLFWLVTRGRKRPPAPDHVVADHQTPEIDALRRIANGDVIAFGDREYRVHGRLEFDEQGYVWREHLLDNGERRRWLCLEDDDAVEVSVWNAIQLADIDDGDPGDRDVIVDDVAYRLQEKGSAQFSALGSTRTAPSGIVEYADYRSADGKLLGFEKFGGSWEAALGATVEPSEITVLPGTGRYATVDA